MKNYSISLRFDDRKLGPTGRSLRVTASNQASAIGKGVREFLKGLTRRERFDAAKKLTVISVRYAEAPAEVYRMVDAAVRG